jgi:hypothetical protein
MHKLHQQEHCPSITGQHNCLFSWPSSDEMSSMMLFQNLCHNELFHHVTFSFIETKTFRWACHVSSTENAGRIKQQSLTLDTNNHWKLA